MPVTAGVWQAPLAQAPAQQSPCCAQAAPGFAHATPVAGAVAGAVAAGSKLLVSHRCAQAPALGQFGFGLVAAMHTSSGAQSLELVHPVPQPITTCAQTASPSVVNSQSQQRASWQPTVSSWLHG